MALATLTNDSTVKDIKHGGFKNVMSKALCQLGEGIFLFNLH